MEMSYVRCPGFLFWRRNASRAELAAAIATAFEYNVPVRVALLQLVESRLRFPLNTVQTVPSGMKPFLG